MELNKEQTIKICECCVKNECDKCPIFKEADYCIDILAPNIIALIKQLTEENTRLQIDYNELYEVTTEEIKEQNDKIFELENRLKECENGYEGTLYLERCKLHDAEEKNKELTANNERLMQRNFNLSESGERVVIAYKKLSEENSRLVYTLEGVMHSVDKWLEGEELEQNEVNRAATMREKTLQIVEKLTEENERLRSENNVYSNNVERIAENYYKQGRADTVREFAERIATNYAASKVYYVGYDAPTITYTLTNWELELLVKKMLEEVDERH